MLNEQLKLAAKSAAAKQQAHLDRPAASAPPADASTSGPNNFKARVAKGAVRPRSPSIPPPRRPLLRSPPCPPLRVATHRRPSQRPLVDPLGGALAMGTDGPSSAHRPRRAPVEDPRGVDRGARAPGRVRSDGGDRLGDACFRRPDSAGFSRSQGREDVLISHPRSASQSPSQAGRS